MNRILSILTMLCVSLSMNASFNDFVKDGIVYRIISENNKSVEVETMYPYYYSGDIIIPEEVEYNGIVYSVISIGNSAFYNCKNLTSVTIPNCVTTIGLGAFAGCNSLPSITIPQSVTSIEGSAFAYCTGLTSVTIPNGITSIEGSVFFHCQKLNSITIPNSVTSIKGNAFEGCISLKSIIIPNSVIDIGMEAFLDCSSLTSVTFGSSVRSIGNYAFDGCSGLTIKSFAVSPPKLYSQIRAVSLEVPLGSTVDYSKANGWNKINKIYAVSNDVYYYPLSFVENGEHIVSVSNLVDNAKEVASNEQVMIVADGIQKSNNVVLVGGQDVSETIIKEGKYVFYPSPIYTENIICSYNYSNKTINVGSSGSLLDKLGIDNLDNIVSIKINGKLNGTDILTIRKMKSLKLLDLTDAFIVDGGLSYYENYTTSKDKIGKYFFYKMDSLIRVLLPLNITSIGHGAFENCNSLASIIIPNSVKTIEDWAFSACHSLTTVVIPNSVTSIGKQSFQDCSNLTSITIPKSVTSLGSAAFSSCGRLNSVTIPDGVTSIVPLLFSGCSNLLSVTIPNSITSIGKYAFANCYNLSSITIPHNVTSIEIEAFHFCSSLTSIVSLNPTPPIIHNQAFDKVTMENATLYVPNGCKTIYWLHPNWENFKNIVELEKSGVGLDDKRNELTKAYDEGIDLYNSYVSSVKREHEIINESSNYTTQIGKYESDAKALIKTLREKLMGLNIDEATKNRYISELDDIQERVNNLVSNSIPTAINDFKPILLAKDSEFDEYNKLLAQYKADSDNAATVEELDNIESKVVEANSKQKESLDSFLKSFKRDTFESELNALKENYEEFKHVMELLNALKVEMGDNEDNSGTTTMSAIKVEFGGTSMTIELSQQPKIVMENGNVVLKTSSMTVTLALPCKVTLVIGSETAIDKVAIRNNHGNAPIDVYSLDGKKVGTLKNKNEMLSLERGIYIINGKKVFIK